MGIAFGRRFIGVSAAAIFLFLTSAHAQESRILSRIQDGRRVSLSGHIHPEARVENDQGRVSGSQVLSYVTLAFAQSATQRADLEQLLSNQANPAAPDYHHWLKPDEYAARFGASQADVDAISAWLQSKGLTIAEVARGRNWIAVNGTASQIENAFQTEIHSYKVNGETHFANATAPTIPAAMTGVVRAIRGLNDFRMKPGRHALKPSYTSTKGSHYLSPDDVATIYDISPMYSAGMNGAGQKLVIAGQTRIALSDIEQFQTKFSLPARDPQTMLVPNAPDPGLSSSDLAEADLDIEWSSAIARNATIIYVYSSDVMVAVQYAIDQNLAPVISTSYGSCELETSASDAATLRSWAQQANAQGITWFAASGDSGAADCGDSQNRGLSVDLPGSLPEVTSVGGTEFSEGSASYWNSTTGTTGASVRSWIPETAWNDSTLDGSPSATGGGSSALFAKPSWQVGTGVPGDNSRHVPDVSLAASADHDGYLVYTGGSLNVFGGTSVPTPVFAGMAALLNQALVANGTLSGAGLGNINPTLYSLAQTAPSAFHDITSGNNIVSVPCARRSTNCTATPVGFSAGSGYDLATGLGSVDFANLSSSWSSAALKTNNGAATMSLVSSVDTVGTGDTVTLIAVVEGSGGVTPSGVVMFSNGSTLLGSTSLVGSGGTATATLEVASTQLALGSETLIASYAGNSTAATASVPVTVQAVTKTAQTMAINSLGNGASFQPAYAPGMILSVFGSGLAAAAQLGSSVPLARSLGSVAAEINGVSASIYYVSPSQLNIQIPYETAAGPALLRLNNNGRIVSQSFTVASAAPGIFVDSNNALTPGATATRGQTLTLYATGAGALTPQPATGAAPAALTAVADLPAPTGAVTLTVGGVLSAITFDGDTPGLIGAIQVNFQVPTGVPLGLQPVILTVGSVASSPAYVTVTN